MDLKEKADYTAKKPYGYGYGYGFSEAIEKFVL